MRGVGEEDEGGRGFVVVSVRVQLFLAYGVGWVGSAVGGGWMEGVVKPSKKKMEKPRGGARVWNTITHNRGELSPR